MKQQAPEYRADLDGLRALAVLSVVFYHLELPGFSGGYVGVDVFFVISGYLITRKIQSELAGGTFSFASFYVGRARRLFPALAATLCASTLAAVLLVDPLHLVGFAKSVLATLGFVSNLFFLAEADYFAPASRLEPLLHTWSLAVEEQFYLIWPALLAACWRRTGASFGAASLASVGLLSVAAAEWYLAVEPDVAFFSLPFRIGEFAVGALALTWERERGSVSRAPNAIFALGLALILGAVIGLDDASRFPGFLALVPCVGAGLMIVARPAAGLGRITRSRPMVQIGLVSYSLYLVHWPLWVFFQYWQFGPVSLAAKFGLFGVSLILSGAFHRFVEQPFRRVSPRTAGAQRSFVAGCVGAACALGLATALIWRGDGLPGRLAPERLRLLESASELPGSECTGVPPPGFACMSGRSDAPTDLFLLGDSHSWHYRVGITALLGDRYRIASVDKNSCPPVFGYDVVENGRNLTDCRRHNAMRRDALRSESGDRSVVVLAARWSLYLFGTPAGLEELGGHAYQLSRGGDLDVEREEAEAWLSEGLDATVRSLVEDGNKVILIGEVPPVGIDPVPCLMRPGFLVGTAQRGCQHLTREEVVERLRFSDSVLEEVARRRGALALIPSRTLCPPGEPYCRILGDREELLYRDDDHLNSDGSRFVMNLFREEVAGYLDAASPSLGQTASATRDAIGATAAASSTSGWRPSNPPRPSPAARAR